MKVGDRGFNAIHVNVELSVSFGRVYRRPGSSGDLYFLYARAFITKQSDQCFNHLAIRHTIHNF